VAWTEDEMIQFYIEPNPWRPGVEEARLAKLGVPVWALVAHFHALADDAEQVARDYDLRPEALQAALAYYRRNKAAIEARIAANAA
jgi:uncharacterized protein (DUF433 family)